MTSADYTNTAYARQENCPHALPVIVHITKITLPWEYCFQETHYLSVTRQTLKHSEDSCATRFISDFGKQGEIAIHVPKQ